MIFKKIAFVLSIVCIITMNAQTPWPVITPEAKPWTRWWWEGSAVDKEGLATAMKLYQEAGLGGLEITPIYGVKGAEDKFINFLSPQWISMFQFTLDEAKKLGLGIDLATGTGWPFGGPWVKPEDACKNIHMKTYSLKAGEELKDSVQCRQSALVRTVSGRTVDVSSLSYPIATNKHLQEFAFDQVRYPLALNLHVLMAYSDKGQKMELTHLVKNGKLNWKAPEGNWQLYALFMGWHGKQVERSAPGGEGDVIDHFSQEALKNYLAEFDKAFIGKNIEGLRSFFNDSYEVDDAKGQSDWTPELFKEFKLRRGYDLKTELAALYRNDATDKNSRVLYDYRLTISELLLEKFTKPWQAWAKEKGKLIRNQSHGSPANILDLYAAIDIPETEGRDALRFKFATSAANVTGKKLASAEAATWLNEHFETKLSDVKKNIDDYFVGGINHIFYHGTNYSPPNDVWPGWLFYAAVHFTPANPFWKDFVSLNNYVARCQSFLQKGKSDNDILIYFPFNDKISQVENEKDHRQIYSENDLHAKTQNDLLYHFDGMNGFESTDFKNSADQLLEKGYTFDFISDKQLTATESTNGELNTSGNNYKTILLSNAKYISVESLTKLIDLVKLGATVIVYKNLPTLVPGLANNEKNQLLLKTLLKRLKFADSEDPFVKQAKLGKGRFLKSDTLEYLVKAANVSRETLTDLNLNFVRRKIDKDNIYFITNSGEKNVKDYVALNIKHTYAIIFDPMLEKKGSAKTKKDDKGNTSVYLDLKPGESCILHLSSKKTEDKPFPYANTNGTATEIKGDWSVTFLSGGPILPKALVSKEPFYWTTIKSSDYQNFSGTAEYTIMFPKPSTPSEAYLLDLGQVEESAEVILNGKIVGTLLGPVYQITIPASSFNATNTLQLRITNSMANRIIALEKSGVTWKKFYNINFPSKEQANRNKDNLFTAENWSPKPSGLSGKVTLTPLNIEQ